MNYSIPHLIYDDIFLLRGLKEGGMLKIDQNGIRP